MDAAANIPTTRPVDARPKPPRKRHELAEIGIRLLDEAHVSWQRAELECELALEAWFDGPPRTCTDRYLSYCAALDREQAAAHDLSACGNSRGPGTMHSRPRRRRRRKSMYQAGARPLLEAYTIPDATGEQRAVNSCGGAFTGKRAGASPQGAMLPPEPSRGTVGQPPSASQRGGRAMYRTPPDFGTWITHSSQRGHAA